MSGPLHRRSFLALLTSSSLAGCNVLSTSENCAFDFSTAVNGWPLPGRDPRNSHAAPVEAAPSLVHASPAWRIEFRRHLGPAVVNDGSLYLASRRVDTDEPQGEQPPSAVFAVDTETGDQRWRHDVVYEDDPGQASLRWEIAVDDNYVYVVQQTFDEAVPNRLVAIDTETGKRAWVHEGIRANGLQLGAGVVFARTDSAVKAINTATGNLCQRFHVQGFFARLFGGRTPQVRPAVVGDRLFVAAVLSPDDTEEAWRYWLSEINLRTGEVAWTSDRFTVEEYVPSAVVADAERMYVPAANRLTAFDHNGDQVWRTSVVQADRTRDRPPLIASVATNGSRLFLEMSAPDEFDGIYGVNAATGEVVWHRSELYGDPVVAGDVVYVQRNIPVTEDEYVSDLHALDGATGKTLGTYRFDAVLAGPPRLVGGRLYARTKPFREDPNEGRPTFRLHSLE